MLLVTIPMGFFKRWGRAGHGGAEVAESPAVRDRGELGLHVEGHAPRAHGQRQSPGVRAVLFGVSFSVMMMRRCGDAAAEELLMPS